MATGCAADGYTTRLTDTTTPTISGALSGNRILATAPAPSGEEWNEDHCGTTGALYKVGVSPTDPVDPRAFRGTWTTTTGPSAVVTYNYTVGGSLSYSWSLWRNGGTGGLCWEDNGTVIATAPAPSAIPGALACSVVP